MDAIQFIVKDIKRGENNPWLKILFLVGVFLFPIIFGLGLRPEMGDALHARIFIPNLLAALLLLLIPFLFLLKKRQSSMILSLITLGSTLGLILAIERIFFPTLASDEFPNQDAFFHATRSCFTAGCIATTLLSIWIAIFAFTVSSWPTRSWRLFLSITTGISSAVMLGFHCDSSSTAHVFLGHVLPGLVFGAIAFLAFEMIFKIKVKRAVLED